MIVIIDCGSQLTQNICRRVRELGVYAEIVPWHRLYNDGYPYGDNNGIEGFIISGGPDSVHAAGAPTLPAQFFEVVKVPVLGICYGMQLMCHMLGGSVRVTDSREYGRTDVWLKKGHLSPLLHKLPSGMTVWQSHGDAVDVEALPDRFKVVASTKDHVAMIEHRDRNLFGVQFHPEVDHTEQGRTILRNFVLNVCQCDDRSYTTRSKYERLLDRVRNQIGHGKVILAVSGGIDSTALAVLLHRAVGKQCTPVFVDNGLLRRGEAAQVQASFELLGLNNVRYIDSTDLFLSALKGVNDADERRRIIGHMFVTVFERVAQEIGDVEFLAQGTLYPDVIESGTGGAKIKRHHNVGGLPEHMQLRVVEPFRTLFKDEVRFIAERCLEMPREIVWRHPFPGPGLAVRVVGAPITPERLEMVRAADTIYLEELHDADVYYDISQAFAALVCVDTVGVMGDAQTEEAMVMLRAVVTNDFMTADVYAMDHTLQQRVATRIINEVRGVNRVLYDVSTKPPATIEAL